MSIVCIVYKERSWETRSCQCLNYPELKYRCTVYFKGSVINIAFIYCAIYTSF